VVFAIHTQERDSPLLTEAKKQLADDQRKSNDSEHKTGERKRCAKSDPIHWKIANLKARLLQRI